MDAPDGIDILIGDHVRCQRMFDRVVDQEPPDPDLVSDIVRTLSVHDAIESEHLYPLVMTRLPDGHDMARASIDEHAHVAAVLAEIARRPVEDPQRVALLKDLVAQVGDHVQHEEAVVFAGLRQHMAPEELARLGQDLQAALVKAPTRPHPHAPRFSVGTKFAASALGPIDRLRDALRRRQRR